MNPDTPVTRAAPDAEAAAPRRTTVKALTVGIGASLALAYGGLAAVLGRFLYPAQPFPRRWLFVSDIAGFPDGEAVAYRLTSGQPVTIARLAASGDLSDFLALSSTCPHLGCQVQWQGQNNRFFCPCHNGVFSPQGEAISGPPAEAGQNLPQYPLKIDDGLLFIEVPTNDLADLRAEGAVLQRDERPPSQPGHDPCLTCTIGSGRRA